MKKYLLILLLLVCSNVLLAQEKPLTIENYYKLKWGHADEFIALWKKNHYPLLKKLQEKGDLLSIKQKPRFCTAARIPAGILK